jgi:hypothetical protein
MKSVAVIIAFLLTLSCAKDNKVSAKQELPDLKNRVDLYCALSQPIYESLDRTIEPACDAALFTSLHGLSCGYVNPENFEWLDTGKLCRRPGCTCYDNDPAPKGERRSDSGFSKDMATGMQLYYSQFPDIPLISRIRMYGNDNKWKVCDGDNPIVITSKCIMSPKIIQRWYDIQQKWSSSNAIPRPPEEDSEEFALVQPVDFQAHLQMLSVLIEHNLYGGISDNSLAAIKAQAEREPNNLLFQAMAAKFYKGDTDRVLTLLLAKFPGDRLPTSADWCTPYLYQRDEVKADGSPNPDWAPCPGEAHTHPGTDFLLASWVLQLGN